VHSLSPGPQTINLTPFYVHFFAKKKSHSALNLVSRESVELHFVSNHELMHTLQCSQVLGTVLAVIQHILRLSVTVL
jgi:hypothetical protein